MLFLFFLALAIEGTTYVLSLSGLVIFLPSLLGLLSLGVFLFAPLALGSSFVGPLAAGVSFFVLLALLVFSSDLQAPIISCCTLPTPSFLMLFSIFRHHLFT